MQMWTETKTVHKWNTTNYKLTTTNNDYAQNQGDDTYWWIDSHLQEEEKVLDQKGENKVPRQQSAHVTLLHTFSS